MTTASLSVLLHSRHGSCVLHGLAHSFESVSLSYT